MSARRAGRRSGWTAGLLLLLFTIGAALPVHAQTAGRLRQLEQVWLELQIARDQLRLTRNLGLAVSPRGEPADTLGARQARLTLRVRALVDGISASSLTGDDAGALAAIREALVEAEAEEDRPEGPAEPADCGDPFPPALRGAGLAVLTRRTFACYGAAARRIVVDRDTLDRLAILGLLGRTDDAGRRRRLFLALEPVWRSVNGDDGAGSPYRRMVALRNSTWSGRGTPMEERARALGIEPDSLERWLVAILTRWRAGLPDTLLEPWDFHYFAGDASRRLSARIPRDSLRPLAERFYRDLGADPVRLGIRYDLDPRPGKYPISYTDFGARDPIEPWVVTSYRIGGFDNLAELLHELGHAVHIAAIRARPAFRDWPDSDTFTEAIAELAALELYDPKWQRRYLGTATPPASTLRSQYGGIVLDVAWSLFEIRVHRSPETSPNQIWTDITRDYLRIRPHAEWSWWALRGQLVGNPGYMLNYAVGAILIADIRERMATLRGRFTAGDPGWYDWVSERLFRFGRARPARAVVEDFLGRRISIESLLRDMSR
ncbi:MAG: hypothetical protein ACT4PM_05725 [Gemmatimonadales bacterium]